MSDLTKLSLQSSGIRAVAICAEKIRRLGTRRQVTHPTGFGSLRFRAQGLQALKGLQALSCRALIIGIAIVTIGGQSNAASPQPIAPPKKAGSIIDADVLHAFEPQKLAAPPEGGLELPYRLMPPAKLEKGKTYPLVLFLHGVGESGIDNEIQLKHAAADFLRLRDRFPAFVLFPQCPKGKKWVESDWTLPSGNQKFDSEPSLAMSQVLRLVDSLSQTLPIDVKRRYVSGLSMGGLGTWFAASDPEKRFAAAVACCGGGDPSWADRYKGVAIWALHGSADNVVPVSRSREMVTALTQAGHHPEIRYSEYPGVNHNSWTRTFARDDVYEWLFSQSK